MPLVYVNRQPVNLDTLPDNQAFVGVLSTMLLHDQFIAPAGGPRPPMAL